MSEKNEALALVTKKVLVTFSHPICIMSGDSAVFSQSLICEFQAFANHEKNDYSLPPRQFVVVGFPDGKKMSRSQILYVANYGTVAAMVELEA